MEPASRPRRSRSVLATALIVLGVLGLIGWKLASGNEALPYANSAAPPASVEVTRGHTYSIAVPGGVDAMLAGGIPAASDGTLALTCSYATGQASTPLNVSAESTGTKAENTVGHFVAPLTGPISVSCDGWGAVFVPDSDDRPTDWAGWALLLGVVALSVGAALALSVAYRRWAKLTGEPSDPPEEGDQVQGGGDVEVVGVGDGEVGDGHGCDGAP